jgi:hypothetical protein
MKRTVILAVLAATAMSLWAQEAGSASPERVTVPFSDPSGPKRLTCSLLSGSIDVKAHNGRDVIVQAATGSSGGSDRRSGRSRRETPVPPGMRRLNNPSSGLQIEEANNTIKIGIGPMNRSVNLEILVPADTSLKLNTINNGRITVEGVTGELDINNLNGNITLTNVGGAVVAHTLNGKLVAALSSVTPDKAMSFSTLNGDVDVTLPASVKANVKMKSDNGDIFTDFEIALKPTAQPPEQGARDSKGRYRIRFDRAMYGAINGGGADFTFTTLNGTITIRKGK